MIDYWTNFAKTGNPNSPASGWINWPSYDTQTDQVMLFNDVSTVQSGIWSQYCSFWDQDMGYDWGS